MIAIAKKKNGPILGTTPSIIIIRFKDKGYKVSLCDLKNLTLETGEMGQSEKSLHYNLPDLDSYLPRSCKLRAGKKEAGGNSHLVG